MTPLSLLAAFIGVYTNRPRTVVMAVKGDLLASPSYLAANAAVRCALASPMLGRGFFVDFVGLTYYLALIPHHLCQEVFGAKRAAANWLGRSFFF